MNESFSKVELMLTAIRTILVDDVYNTYKEVREIKYYAKDRIFRSNLNSKEIFPQIILSVDEMDSNIALPTQRMMLNISIYVNKNDSNAHTTLDRISSRIEFLLNKKNNNINNVEPNKNLRCRKIIKVSAITSIDNLMDVISKTIIFDIIVDDEIIICN